MILTEPDGFAGFAVSENGTLVSLPVDDSAQALRRMVWVDRMGGQELVPAPPRLYASPRLSPDGTRVALVEQRQGSDVSIWDFGRSTLAVRMARESSSGPQGPRRGGAFSGRPRTARAQQHQFLPTWLETPTRSLRADEQPRS